MTVEEIARKVCELAYAKLCEQGVQEKQASYSLEEYWKKNRKHFIERAETYLEVKACLEAK